MASVKDRARMFGELASPPKGENERSFRRIGTKVTSSPFLSPSSKKTTPTASKFSASPFASSSPKVSTSEVVGRSPSVQQNFSIPKEKKIILSSPSGARDTKESMGWPAEDGIPTPGAIRNDNKITEPEEKVGPVSKFANSPSPFKVINNQGTQQGLHLVSELAKSKVGVGNSPLKTLQIKEKQFKAPVSVPNNTLKPWQKKRDESSIVSKPNQGNVSEPPETKEPTQIHIKEKQFKPSIPAPNNTSKPWHTKAKDSPTLSKEKQTSNTSAIPNEKTPDELENPAQNQASLNGNENSQSNANTRNKSTRAIRLMRARRANGAPPTNVSTSLKQSRL